MVCFIHKNGIKLDLLQQVDRIRHSYETFGIEVDLLVVASAYFAEAGEVGSELIQKSKQRHRNQNLRMMARNGTDWHGSSCPAESTFKVGCWILIQYVGKYVFSSAAISFETGLGIAMMESQTSRQTNQQ